LLAVVAQDVEDGLRGCPFSRRPSPGRVSCGNAPRCLLGLRVLESGLPSRTAYEE
jgi:hypothetical protein